VVESIKKPNATITNNTLPKSHHKQHAYSVAPSSSLTSFIHKRTPIAALEKKMIEDAEQKRLTTAATEAANGVCFFVCESTSVAMCACVSTVLSVPKRFPARQAHCVNVFTVTPPLPPQKNFTNNIHLISISHYVIHYTRIHMAQPKRRQICYRLQQTRRQQKEVCT